MRTRSEQPRGSVPGRARRSAAAPSTRPSLSRANETPAQPEPPAPRPSPAGPTPSAGEAAPEPAAVDPTAAPPRSEPARPFRPWTRARGPIRARGGDVERARRVNDLLVAPIGVLPTAEGDVVRPFRIGLGAEIAARRKPEVPATALKRAIHDYARSFLYIFATAQPGSMRHDLAGTPVEPVSETDRHAAQRDSQSRIARARLRRVEREAGSFREAASPVDADADGTGTSSGPAFPDPASPDPAEGPHGVMDAKRSTRPCV